MLKINFNQKVRWFCKKSLSASKEQKTSQTFCQPPEIIMLTTFQTKSLIKHKILKKNFFFLRNFVLPISTVFSQKKEYDLIKEKYCEKEFL